MIILYKVRCITAININHAKLLGRVSDKSVIEMPDTFEDYNKLIRDLPYQLPNHPEIKKISDMETEEFRCKIHFHYRWEFYKMVYGLSDVIEWQLLTEMDLSKAYSKKRYRKVEINTWKEWVRGL